MGTTALAILFSITLVLLIAVIISFIITAICYLKTSQRPRYRHSPTPVPDGIVATVHVPVLDNQPPEPVQVSTGHGPVWDYQPEPEPYPNLARIQSLPRDDKPNQESYSQISNQL
jgi:hypothetical protein